MNLDLACKQLCSPPRGNYKKEKRKYSWDEIKLLHCSLLQLLLTCKNWLNVVAWKPVFSFNTTTLSCTILNLKNKTIQLQQLLKFFPVARFWHYWEIGGNLAALGKETQEYSRDNQSQNSSAPAVTQDCIAQVSEEIEERVTKNLSQDFSRTDSRILGALSKLDEFLVNPQIQAFSGITPGRFWNKDVENQEPSGLSSQNDPQPEVKFPACRASILTHSDTEETSHKHYLKILTKDIPKRFHDQFESSVKHFADIFSKSE